MAELQARWKRLDLRDEPQRADLVNHALLLLEKLAGRRRSIAGPAGQPQPEVQTGSAVSLNMIEDLVRLTVDVM
jgi:hypothetical protein